MGHYCSIKGWLETSFDVLPALQQQIQTYWLDATVTEPTLERREMYFQAWRFAQLSSNWSAYTFLGLDFQQQYLDWLKTGMQQLLMQPLAVIGYFEISDEEDDESLTVWHMRDGAFTESQKHYESGL